MSKVLKISILLFIVGWSSSSLGQVVETQVSRVQRSIFIYNLAEQVSWPSDLKNSFRIGVLGPDRSIIDFKAMSQSRDIKTLPVEVVNFLAVKDVQDIDLLYVHKRYNFQMPYILKSLKNKDILVVSENYNFDAAMINIVRVGNSFRHQMNEQLLKDYGFNFSPTLKSFSIKTSEKWLALYQQSQDSLKAAQQRLRIQDSIIDRQATDVSDKTYLLDTIREVVRIKDTSIDELLSTEELQKKTIEEKRVIERELEMSIKEQAMQLVSQDSIINARAQKILIQQDSISKQQVVILAQENEFIEQSFELTLTKNLNWILGIIALLLLAAGIITYRSYRSKDRLSKELSFKNATIQHQSDQLVRKNEDLEQFAYIASHDLQEPLNTISSFIGLIKNDYQDQFDDLGKQSIDFIEEASLRMKRLIKVLLEYSRIERSRVFTPVNCNLLVKDLIKDLDSLISKSNATIKFDSLPTVSGSEFELRLLFQNLITNALKFCPEDRLPILKIKAIKTESKIKQDQKVWKFSFEDNGIGIPKEHQDRIFLIFQRLHSTDEYAGTGIGLAHCKKIVAIHNGTIWLESEENKGTTFYFTIPIE